MLPRSVSGSGGGAARGPIGSTSSFQDFQNSVRDAWDIGDDEFCIVSEMSSEFIDYLFLVCVNL